MAKAMARYRDTAWTITVTAPLLRGRKAPADASRSRPYPCRDKPEPTVSGWKRTGVDPWVFFLVLRLHWNNHTLTVGGEGRGVKRKGDKSRPQADRTGCGPLVWVQVCRINWICGGECRAARTSEVIGIRAQSPRPPVSTMIWRARVHTHCPIYWLRFTVECSVEKRGRCSIEHR